MADSQPTSPRKGSDGKLPVAHKRCKSCSAVLSLATKAR